MSFTIIISTLVACLTFAGPLSAEPAFIRLAVEGDNARIYSSEPATGPDTPFAIASVGKTFTAVAVLRLVDRGVLKLDAAVADLVPKEISRLFDGMPGIRVHHLLTMTSGLPDYYTDDWLEDALADPERSRGVDAALRAAAEEPILFRPGLAFDYSNTNYVLLGLILETAMGKSYAEVMRSEVFAPVGLRDSFVFGSRTLPPDFAKGHRDRALVHRVYSGPGLGDGGIIASARDVAQFYQALFIERRLLSDAALARMLSDPLGEGYGMGVEIDGQIVGHSGGDVGYSSDVRLDLYSGVVAVVMIADEDAEDDWALDQLDGR